MRLNFNQPIEIIQNWNGWLTNMCVCVCRVVRSIKVFFNRLSATLLMIYTRKSNFCNLLQAHSFYMTFFLLIAVQHRSMETLMLCHLDNGLKSFNINTAKNFFLHLFHAARRKRTIKFNPYRKLFTSLHTKLWERWFHRIKCIVSTPLNCFHSTMYSSNWNEKEEIFHFLP